MVRKIFTVAAVAGFMLTNGGPVQATEGWYVSANAGVSFLQDSATSNKSTELLNLGFGLAEHVLESDYKHAFDKGLGLFGALGYSWGNVRLEGELSYRKNNLGHVSGVASKIDGISLTVLGIPEAELPDPVGDIRQIGFMANGYYDFDMGSNWVPFVMAGVGAAKVTLDGELDATSIDGPVINYNASDTVFAYQAGVGLGYKISSATTLNLSYRFIGTDNLSFTDAGREVRAENQSHNMMVGITYSL